MLTFAIVIQENRKIGYVLAPFLVEKAPSGEFYKTKELITSEKLNSLTNYLSEENKCICEILFKYEDKELFRIFNKKKDSVKSFIDTLPADLLETHIRPFVEKYIGKAIPLIIAHQIPVYFRKGNENLHQEDRVQIESSGYETTFYFVKGQEGLKYKLSLTMGENEVALVDKPFYELTQEPCNIIIDNTLYSLDNIDSKKLRPFFSKEFISIPERLEEQYFKTFVLNSIRKYKVLAHGFGIEKLYPKVKTALKLEKSLELEYVFTITFKYDKVSFDWSHKLKKKVLFTYKDSVPKYVETFRDMKMEASILQTLKSLGLQERNGVFIAKDFTNYEWLNGNKEKLREMEVDVLLNDTPVSIKETTVDTVISEEVDWFDLKINITYGNFVIPFKYILNNIRDKNPIYTLPNGEIAILPDEWFAEFGPLIENNDFKNNGFVVKKHHFGQLVNLKHISPENKEKYLGNLIGLLESNVQTKQPKGINAQLRPYQMEGYSWLYNLYKNELGGILADDMGLGKTLQTITLLQQVVAENSKDFSAKTTAGTAPVQLSMFDAPPVPQPKKAPCSLVVVPTSLVFNWLREFQKFTKNMKVATYVGGKRTQNTQIFEENDVVLTTYGLVRNDIEFLESYEFLYIILDESQYIKNPSSKIYQAVIKLSSQHKLVLTGTPIENNLNDLWAQMNFINDGILGNLASFNTKYVRPIEQNDEEAKERLKKLITPFIKRRSKKLVAKDLPDVTELVVECEMLEGQRKLYDQEKSKIRNLLLEKKRELGIKKLAPYILQALSTLRQISNHPLMVDDSSNLESGKYEEITSALQKVMSRGHKILVFSSFVKHLKIIESYLHSESCPYSLITGETKDREAEVAKFQNNDEVHVFLISLKAGGVGLNLTAADYVFILDPWWNPASENQAIGRAHRIGQENKVFVYRFITQDSVEEKIIALQQKKKIMAEEFISDESNLTMNEETLEYLFD